MEYKFRGFDAVGNKGWVYGDLVHNKKITKTGLEDPWFLPLDESVVFIFN